MRVLSKWGAPVATALFATVLAGCAPFAKQPPPAELEAAHCVAAIDDYRSTERLLAERRSLCALPENERQQRSSYQQNSGKYALLQALLIRSCTPLQQEEHLDRISTFLEQHALTDAELGLLTMLSDHRLQLLELSSQADALRRELKKTIEGISDIEAQINQQQHPAEEL
ncbi:MAG: hypothetical protein ACPHN3_10360 [Spongiibacter sp.]